MTGSFLPWRYDFGLSSTQCRELLCSDVMCKVTLILGRSSMDLGKFMAVL
jgi:flagellar motor switch/type III secretory pathway protein FliN